MNSTVIKEHIEAIHFTNANEKNLLNSKDDDYVTVLHRLDEPVKKGDKVYHLHHYNYKKSEVIDKVIELNHVGKKDIYISHSTFYMPKRGYATLYRLNTICMDIDLHVKGTQFDPESILYYLNEDYFNQSIPLPSEIVSSGRGLQLYWYLEHCPRKALPVWRIVTSQIYKVLKGLEDIFKDLEVDETSKDAVHVTRVPGTINSKVDKPATILLKNDIRYNLYEILEEYFPHVDFRKYVGTNKKKSTKNLSEAQKEELGKFSQITLLCTRADDLETLLHMRGDALAEGIRDEFLYIYGWTVIQYDTSEERFVSELEAVNTLFKDPLKPSEIEYKARHIYQKFKSKHLKTDNPDHKYSYYDRYIFRNTTIIKKLKITKKEMKKLKTIIDKEEKYERNNKRRRDERRNENDLTPREQAYMDNLNKVRELFHQGMKQKDIATETGLSKSRVSELCKIIKNEGK